MNFWIKKSIEDALIFIITKFKKECEIKFNNYSIYLPPEDRCGANIYIKNLLKNNWVHESFEQSIISSLLENDPSNFYFIDVGASYGLFTFLAAPFSNVKKIISVEASPKTFSYLNKSVQSNGLSEKVICLNAAVSSSQGEVFYIEEHPRYSEWNRVFTKIPSDENNKESSEVNSVTIDNIISEYLPSVSSNDKILIKIDIEGGEPSAFIGMNRLFSSETDFIMMIEFHAGLLNIGEKNGSILFAKEIWSKNFCDIYQIDHRAGCITKFNSLGEFLSFVDKLNNSQGFDRISNLLICNNPLKIKNFL